MKSRSGSSWTRDYHYSNPENQIFTSEIPMYPADKTFYQNPAIIDQIKQGDKVEKRKRSELIDEMQKTKPDQLWRAN